MTRVVAKAVGEHKVNRVTAHNSRPTSAMGLVV
jgi:hypothetical protein